METQFLIKNQQIFLTKAYDRFRIIYIGYYIYIPNLE